LPDGIRCKASSAALGDLIPEEHFEQAEGVEFIFPTIEPVREPAARAWADDAIADLAAWRRGEAT